MPFFSSFWSIHGVSPEARDAAVRAASVEGVELGVWLSDVIHKVNADELSATEAEKRSANAVQSKLTSIERAMLRGGAGDLNGNLGPT